MVPLSFGEDPKQALDRLLDSTSPFRTLEAQPTQQANVVRLGMRHVENPSDVCVIEWKRLQAQSFRFASRAVHELRAQVPWTEVSTAASLTKRPYVLIPQKNRALDAQWSEWCILSPVPKQRPKHLPALLRISALQISPSVAEIYQSSLSA